METPQFIFNDLSVNGVLHEGKNFFPLREFCDHFELEYGSEEKRLLFQSFIAKNAKNLLIQNESLFCITEPEIYIWAVGIQKKSEKLNEFRSHAFDVIGVIMTKGRNDNMNLN